MTFPDPGPDGLSFAYQAVSEHLGGAWQAEALKSGVAATSFYFREVPGPRDLVVRIDGRSLLSVQGDFANAERARSCGVFTHGPALFVAQSEALVVSARPWIASDAIYASPDEWIGISLSQMHSTPAACVRLGAYAHWRDFASRAITLTRSGISIGADIASIALDLLTVADGGLIDVDSLVLSDGSLTHGDLKGENIILADSKHALIDWDKSGTLSRQLDLGLALFFLIGRTDGLQLEQSLTTALGAYGLNPGDLDGPWSKIREDVEVAARLFVLRDAVMAADSADSRRDRYFRGFSLPTYARFASRFPSLKALTDIRGRR